MENRIPKGEDLMKGFTLRPSDEYLKEFEFVEAEVIETRINGDESAPPRLQEL